MRIEHVLWTALIAGLLVLCAAYGRHIWRAAMPEAHAAYQSAPEPWPDPPGTHASVGLRLEVAIDVYPSLIARGLSPQEAAGSAFDYAQAFVDEHGRRGNGGSER